jgi:membrane protease YdiL (CAAX protease family)
VTHLGLLNIFLGGVLLGLAYARWERLWFPIGLHLAWNLMTGPILGHEVSGYESMHTLFIEKGEGATWITGGEFGLEGSAWMTVIEVTAIGLLARLEYDPQANTLGKPKERNQ